jgi:glycosyltransferase involved in cell wall biosynthesis
MARMNMLQLNFEKGWRGGERQTLYNMIGFRNVGYRVALLCRSGCPLELKAKAEGFDTFGFKDIFGVIFFLTFKCRKYYVFHVQTSHILTHALFTRIFHGARIIFTRRIDNTPKGRLTRWKYHLTDTVVVISNAIKEVIENFANKKVVVISDIGVERKLDESHARKLIDNLKINEETFIIATTAALTKDKAPTIMLEAIRILALKKKILCSFILDRDLLKPK